LARGSHLGGFKLWEKSVVDKYEEDADKVRQQAGSGGSA
jgi:multisubunit Na+/H+ antiporter MnhG subunit